MPKLEWIISGLLLAAMVGLSLFHYHTAPPTTAESLKVSLPILNVVGAAVILKGTHAIFGK